MVLYVQRFHQLKVIIMIKPFPVNPQNSSKTVCASDRVLSRPGESLPPYP